MADRTKIQTFRSFEPKIYAYTLPDVSTHQGFIKIGYTEQDVDDRIQQQVGTSAVRYVKEWAEPAVFHTPPVRFFKDQVFHSYLEKQGYERMQASQGKSRKPEFFRISPKESLEQFLRFVDNHGLIRADEVINYSLRDEQEEAVAQTLAYAFDHDGGEYLWNAKPRFGKTLSIYEFAKRYGAQNILIVTNRPAIANSWYSDYKKFIGTRDQWYFVSRSKELLGQPGVLSKDDFSDRAVSHSEAKSIWFVSLQDLKGSKYFGTGQYDKLKEVADMEWDLLVIDEAHEAIDTSKTDVAFDRIKRKFTIHLSGTPFKALANDKFHTDAIYNWTYADEQKKKQELERLGIENNPYRDLPTMNLFTYQMSDIISQEVEQGTQIGEENIEFAFDLNEFFKTKNGIFIHDKEVDQWLDSLTTQEKFPFSTPQLRDELKHTFWMLKFVDSVNALEKKLKVHSVFKDYKIINVAGSGKNIEDDDPNEKMVAFEKVRSAIDSNNKTITLSAGRLSTGITVPEWSAVLMLSNMKSPALYMQTAFRAQNPYSYTIIDEKGKEVLVRKENAYVFDFDPARTLDLFEKFALDLNSQTSDGRADLETREEKIKELLNFFPVIGEDPEGRMIELDAEQVLSIPQKIRSAEVVKRGFMSDFLFQNVAHVFNAPKEVIQLVLQFEPVKESSQQIEFTEEDGDRLNIDENGEINPSTEKIIGQHQKVFGNKVYRKKTANEVEVEARKVDAKAQKKALENIKRQLTEQIPEIKQDVQEEYGDSFQKKDQKRWDKNTDLKAERLANKIIGNREAEYAHLETDKTEALNKAKTAQERSKIEEEFHQKAADIEKSFREEIAEQANVFTDEAMDDILREAEISSSEKEVNEKIANLKDHLRGFSRTIPSFLMAYGDENIRLSNLENYIDPKVFEEVTSVTFDQFRLLRDGYITEDGKEFIGHLFDETVFNDSVREFLKLKDKLKNYFDPNQKDDIFNYIPSQKTNQIFTPRRVVREMVAALEAENPSIFDDPNKTFADLYMKSGLYISEIVKKLFNSDGLKATFPDEKERLNHIFSKQIYGMAPTEIIYLIARNFILGFTDDSEVYEHHLIMADASKAAQEGKLQELVDQYYD